MATSKAAKKAWITRRRRAAGKKAASTKRGRVAARKAALTRRRRQGGQRAAATKRRAAALPDIERNFHEVILARAAEGRLRVPDPLPHLDAVERKSQWFPVPGMYGGFKYWWDPSNPEPLLVAESWCRVVEGSGQRHHITRRSAQLVDEGFV